MDEMSNIHHFFYAKKRHQLTTPFMYAVIEAG